MSDFTVEQMEALKKGTTPGPWVITPYQNPVGIQATRWHDIPMEIANARLAAAAPELVDALIAEKQAHAKLRAELADWKKAAEESGDRASKVGDYVRAFDQNVTISHLTHILGADNE